MEKNGEILEVKSRIIYTLHKKRYYNKRHTPIDSVCKKIKKAIIELKREEIIKTKPTYHGLDVCLNVKKKNEIDKYLNRYSELKK